MHKNVHRNPIQNSLQLESTQSVINSRMDKYIVIYLQWNTTCTDNDLRLLSITQIFKKKKKRNGVKETTQVKVGTVVLSYKM